MALEFPMYISTSNRTVSVVGFLNKEKKQKKEVYIDGKGYIDDDGIVWIFSGGGKPHAADEYPYFWITDKKEKEFSNPSENMLNAFKEENMVDMSLVNIVDRTEPDEELFDEEAINDMNAAAEIYVPPIKKTDDYLKKIVKAVIIKKGININRLKSKTDEKYMIPNMRSALNNDTKMSVLYFSKWMELLGCDFQIDVRDNGEDTQNPLKTDVSYDSYRDKVGTVQRGELVEITNFNKDIDKIIDENEE